MTWLTVYGGAERVLEQMLACFRQVELFSTVEFLPETERGFLGGRSVRHSSCYLGRNCENDRVVKLRKAWASCI